MSLDTRGANQTGLNRPTEPRDPNGIAHATDSTDTGNSLIDNANTGGLKVGRPWAT